MIKILIGCFDVPPNTDSFMNCDNCLSSDGENCNFSWEHYKVYNESQKPSNPVFKCPDCNELTDVVLFENKVFFSCNNIFCGNIKLYDVFTLHARSPIIMKVE